MSTETHIGCPASSPRVCLSLAAFPNLRPAEAVEAALRLHAQGELVEPAFGKIDLACIQLVPQCAGLLDEEAIAAVQRLAPAARLRLHANVRVLERHTQADLAVLEQHLAWFRQAAQIHRIAAGDVYSAHPGLRRDATFEQLVVKARRAAEIFGCPVAIEGQYPRFGSQLLVSTWKEYVQLLDSDVPYAIDMSHLNILARTSGQENRQLIRELLASERCLEVHISDNDGHRDAHQVCSSQPWWSVLLGAVHERAVIFTEGSRRSKTK